ncbi:hypothetical protein SAMN04487906_1660 [Zhouia amylolytica]|uniref:Ferredoxin subunit of nitrite reductase or a ring-hydroxylating dioxygenase n=1 Tax=Zhouia amylolytica TaxID=376730 RepID=A0A1I6SK33_9FLAO|nr:hypothetical protein [Zhouia amylolytica]SFS77220.1 hypothetical protein SAMN04487906_1660 [Zhouia amylolytica]
MKKIITYICSFIFLACSNDSSTRNPYLPETNFSFEINLNLPLYGSLANPGSAIYIGNEGVGLKGVFVYNAGFGQFLAWEASCPNHTPTSCSTMTIINGNMCKCSCEDYEYSLVNGTMLSEIPADKKIHELLIYRTTANDNVVTIFN